jgi:DNA repair photolyase
MNTGIIVWGKKVSRQFRAKVVKICDNLGIEVNWLMPCIAFETGETFSASVKNAAGSGATGLIQFMPSTAKSLGITTEALSQMSAVQQLDYVEKYFLPYKGRIKSLEDCYMAILWPAAVGKPVSYVLFDKGKRYLQNRGLDVNKDGKITKAECSLKIWQKFEKGLRSENAYLTTEYYTETGLQAEKLTQNAEYIPKDRA